MISEVIVGLLNADGPIFVIHEEALDIRLLRCSSEFDDLVNIFAGKHTELRQGVETGQVIVLDNHLYRFGSILLEIG